MTQPPLVPADCDVRSLPSFDLYVDRLISSELTAIASGEGFRASVLLWCRAWKQVPAASLPDDDRVLAGFVGRSVPQWRKVRMEALRGFVKCSDGRLYHPLIAELAIKGDASRRKFLAKREADNERLRKWRDAKGETRNETVPATPGETRFETHCEQTVPVPVPEDYRSAKADLRIGDEIWRSGLDYLTANGVKQPHARSLLGKWKRDFGDPLTLAGLIEAQKNSISEPVAWITKFLEARRKAAANGADPDRMVNSYGIAYVRDRLTGEWIQDMGAA